MILLLMTSDIDRKVKLEKLFDNKKHVAPTVGEEKAASANAAGKIFRAEKLKITRKNEPVPCVEPAFCISNCKFSARIALKSSTVPLKSIFMAKT